MRRMRLGKLKSNQEDQFAFKILNKSDEKLHKAYRHKY